MKTTLTTVLLGALLLAGCEREGPKSGPSQPKSGEKQWSEDEMATNPEGYLKWADGKLAAQITEREQRLKDLAGKRTDISDRRNKFMGDYEAISNLESRLGTATRRAEDEDGWPVTVAGKQFTKEQSETILSETRRFLTERQALAAAYGEAMTRLDQADRTLRDDISRLSALRDKVSVDIERVKINASNPDVEKLRKTEEEIRHYSKVLTSFQDVSVPNLQPKQSLSADVQAMLH